MVPGERDSVAPFGNGQLHTLAGPTQVGTDSYRRFKLHGALARLLQELEPDVIEVASHYALPGMVRRAVARRPKPTAIIGFFHCHPKQVVQNVTAALPGDSGGKPWHRRLGVFSVGSIGNDATLVASQHIQDALESRGVPRVRRVGLGVDVETFRPSREGPDRAAQPVTYAGRFTRDKELPLLLEAFDGVHARTGIGLRLVGEGPLRKRIDDYAKTRPWVVVQDFVATPGEMAKVLAQSAAVVVPSQTETFSFVTAEALASGTPVVGADRGAVRELVQDSGCRLTFSSGNADSLAGALELLLLRSQEERDAMGERGRVHVLENLTWPQVVGRIVNTYHQAVASVASQQGQTAPAGADVVV